MDVSAIAAENRWIGTQLPLVARDGSRIVAYRGLASRRPGVAHRSVDVGAGARRRGIGRALISRAIAWARASGFRKIALNVFAHHTAAIACMKATASNVRACFADTSVVRMANAETPSR